MRWRCGLAVLVCGSLALVACGGDDDDAVDAARDGALGGQPSDGDGDGNGDTSVPPEVGGGTGGPIDLPDDACAVLPPGEVEALVPGARSEGPEKTEADGSARADCSWVNDTRTLNLTYLYMAGVPSSQLKLSMESATNDANGELTTIGGDDAGIRTLITGDLEIIVVHDQVYLTVGLLTIDGPAGVHRDALVSLTEAAVGSL